MTTPEGDASPNPTPPPGGFNTPSPCTVCEARERLNARGEYIHFHNCPHCGKRWVPGQPGVVITTSVRPADIPSTSTNPCTGAQVATFNRALYRALPGICEESGVPATHVALYGEFVMGNGSVLRANLTPPLDDEPDTSRPLLKRLSIPGNLCKHCDTVQDERLRCPGCGQIDPLTYRPQEAPDA